jgi:serine/threonine-protein kinase GIN4
MLSRVRCGVDCTTEVLHEIALLSICSESSKIVHLKDVFQNHQEIVLVLE